MSTDTSSYTPPAPQRPAPASRRRWLLALLAAWAVLLVALSYLSVRTDAPTVREQRNLAEAAPIVDRAIGALVAAAAGPQVVLELTPPRLERGCRVTPFMDGATLRRGLIVYASEAEIRGLLDRIAQRLPDDYRAGVYRGESGRRLRADAGGFVPVSGRAVGAGQIELTARTGCRPVPDDFALAEPAPIEPAVERELDRVLAALGGAGAGVPERVSAPCPGGGTSGTVLAAASASAPFGPALQPLAAGAAVVTDIPERYAYRTGVLSVVAKVTGDQSQVAITTSCP